MFTVDIGRVFYFEYQNTKQKSLSVKDTFLEIYEKYIKDYQHFYVKNSIMSLKNLDKFIDQVEDLDNNLDNKTVLEYGCERKNKKGVNCYINTTSFALANTGKFIKEDAYVSWFSRLVSVQIEGVEIFINNSTLIQYLIYSNEYYKKILVDTSINLLTNKAKKTKGSQISKFNRIFIHFISDNKITLDDLKIKDYYNELVLYALDNKYIESEEINLNKMLFFQTFLNIGVLINKKKIDFYAANFGNTTETFGFNTIDLSDVGNIKTAIKEKSGLITKVDSLFFDVLDISFKKAIKLSYITIFDLCETYINNLQIKTYTTNIPQIIISTIFKNIKNMEIVNDCISAFESFYKGCLDKKKTNKQIKKELKDLMVKPHKNIVSFMTDMNILVQKNNMNLPNEFNENLNKFLFEFADKDAEENKLKLLKLMFFQKIV